MALKCIKEIFESNCANLTQMQILMGRLNNFCQMGPFMKIFLTPLYLLLTEISNSAVNMSCVLNQTVKNDLHVWVRFLTKKCKWLPICQMYYDPPVSCKTFSSDAAGVLLFPKMGFSFGVETWFLTTWA